MDEASGPSRRGPSTRHLHVLDHPARAKPNPTGAGPVGWPPPGVATAPPEAPVVVLVHGSLDRATSFGRVVRRLPELHVITYDRRGYGGSRGVVPLAEDLELHVQDLLQVVGERRAVVVGHSLGGDVAMAAAIEAPDRIVAVGAYEPPLPWMAWWPRRSQPSLEGVDPGRYAEQFFRRMVGDSAWDHLNDRARADRLAEGPALVAELRAIRGERPPFDVAALTVPAVFGRGGQSAERHRAAAAALHAAVPGSQLLDIAGASHGAHLTHPDAFADLVRTTVSAAGATPHRATGS